MLLFLVEYLSSLTLLHEPNALSVALTGLLTVVFLVVIARELLFKTEKFVNLLIKDEDNKVVFTTFNVHRSTVLTISIIVTGGVILVNEIPNLATYIFRMYKEHSQSDQMVIEDYWMITALVKILIAIYLLYRHRLIVNWIEKRRKA